MTIPQPRKDGTCPFKRDDKTNCVGHRVSGPIVCQMIRKPEQEAGRADTCQRYFYEAGLIDIAPQVFCCTAFENLFHDCIEDDGFAAGAFDIRRGVNDKKDVWRNFVRTRFEFCPYCGAMLIGEFAVQWRKEKE